MTNKIVLVKNQTQHVKEYLKQGNTLTTYTAMIELGVSRLSNHISILRKQGERITSRRGRDITGKSCLIYSMDEATASEVAND